MSSFADEYMKIIGLLFSFCSSAIVCVKLVEVLAVEFYRTNIKIHEAKQELDARFPEIKGS